MAPPLLALLLALPSGAQAPVSEREASIAAIRARVEEGLGELKALQARYGELGQFRRLRPGRARLRQRINADLMDFGREVEAYREMSQDADRELAATAIAQLLTTGIKEIELGPTLRSHHFMGEMRRFLRETGDALRREEEEFGRAQARLRASRNALWGGAAVLAAATAWAEAARRRRRNSPSIPLTLRMKRGRG